MSLDLVPVTVNAGSVPNMASDDWTDLDAYRQLYVSVIQLAIKVGVEIVDGFKAFYFFNVDVICVFVHVFCSLKVSPLINPASIA